MVISVSFYTHADDSPDNFSIFSGFGVCTSTTIMTTMIIFMDHGATQHIFFFLKIIRLTENATSTKPVYMDTDILEFYRPSRQTLCKYISKIFTCYISVLCICLRLALSSDFNENEHVHKK